MNFIIIPSITLPSKRTICDNLITLQSYFNTALVTISKLNKEYRTLISEFYIMALNESASDTINSLYKNFVSGVTYIIDKFNKCVRDNHANYISSLKRKMASDKISIDKNKITDVRAGNIYNYTISDNIPKIIDSNLYYEEIEKLQKILKNNSVDQDQKIINLLFIYNELMEDLRGPFYNRFRGEILGLKQEVSALEYTDVLFAIYRDGGKQINTIIEKDEIKLLQNKVEKVIKQISEEILSGEITQKPIYLHKNMRKLKEICLI